MPTRHGRCRFSSWRASTRNVKTCGELIRDRDTTPRPRALASSAIHPAAPARANPARPSRLAQRPGSDTPQSMHPILEPLARRLAPFEHDRDALAVHALATIERRLAASAPHERDAFQAGLAALDAAAHAREARPFIELDPARQDALLAALDEGQLESS